MRQLIVSNYNLNSTLESGQTFVWQKIGNNFYGTTSERLLKLSQKDETIYWETNRDLDDSSTIVSYLRSDVNYSEIVKQISRDQHITEALEHYSNLRILKQPFEDTVVSFIISANSNIPKIRRSIKLLSEMYGEKVEYNGKLFYLFPKVEGLARAKVEDLRKTGIGYRAEYVLDAAQKLAKLNIKADELNNLAEVDLLKLLLEIKGIGPKVADCILVYGLGYDHITPIDVWGKRIFTELYKLDPKANYKYVRQWATDYFQGYAAWAGQYLYEYMRNVKSKQYNPSPQAVP